VRALRQSVLRLTEALRGLASTSSRSCGHRLAHVVRDERGQSVVEFGLVDTTHVANQIARQAAVNSTTLATLSQECGQLETSELRTGSSSVDPAVITISYPDGMTVGNAVNVQVAARYKFIPFIGTSWTIKGRATMRLEHDQTNIPASGSCS
jgi:hypothetical protein